MTTLLPAFVMTIPLTILIQIQSQWYFGIVHNQNVCQHGCATPCNTQLIPHSMRKDSELIVEGEARHKLVEFSN